MRLRLTVAAGLALATALAVPAAAAVSVPRAAGAAPTCAGLPKHGGLPVVDAAGVLDVQRSAYLTGDLMRFAMNTDVAIVAATVPDLGGDDVSSYARRLFDCWGVGNAESNRGVLILAAMRERRVRIEIGRGLASELPRAELERAVAAMTAPMRAGNVAGALRAAAAEVATALGKTLPDLEAFMKSGGTAGLEEFGIPENAIPGFNDGTPSMPPGLGTDQVPGIPNPFRDSGGGAWIPKGVLAVLGLGVLGTFARAIFRGGLRAIGGAGQTVWRGGFPSFGGGSRGWSDPTLLQGGHWSTPSAPLASGGGSVGGSVGGSSGGSGGGGGSTFGGGSSGGGGASGSW